MTIQNKLMDQLVASWYEGRLRWFNYFLWPVSQVYRLIAQLRRQFYQSRWLPSRHLGVPVIVVGNITVGGSGKTPLVIWLVKRLQAQGYRPAVVSRGYGGTSLGPRQVEPTDSPREVGDESLLILRQTQAPVYIGRKRALAVEQLINEQQPDIIVADDGLQHYALARDIEIALVDVKRGLGNGLCIPAGPLREPVERLSQVDFVVYKNTESSTYTLNYQFGPLINLANNSAIDPPNPPDEVHAVAGIADPESFFRQLETIGYTVIRHPFGDHHVFKPTDIVFNDSKPVMMTEKDAVKCQSFANQQCWFQVIEARVNGPLIQQITAKMSQIALST